MNLSDALTRIARHYELDANELINYASEDGVGGYHTNASEAKWPVGSMWEVEGKILYALIRALKPRRLAEFGTLYGCSAVHMLTALEANGQGVLWSVDYDTAMKPQVPEYLHQRWVMVYADGSQWLSKETTPFDLLFEDMLHLRDQVKEWWQIAPQHVTRGGLLLSHDSEHWDTGHLIKEGIADAGISDLQSYLIEPSDCGIAIWRAQ